MADEADIANNLIDIEVKRALDKMRGGGLQTVKRSKFCVVCDDTIPEARQKLGFNLCVPCAQESERRKALFADE